jgi:hypothetical protein
VVGIDRDHFLDYSAKSKISSFLPNTIQLLRCDPPKWASERGADTDRSPSDPLVGGLLESRTLIRGSMASRRPSTLWSCRRLGWSRDLRFAGRPQGGGDEETRTPDPLLAKETLCRLSYVPTPGGVVGVSGLEPETSALSGQCSNQLS